jgi:tRNA G18 (ribose-2'-O)-methylase SpoU
MSDPNDIIYGVHPVAEALKNKRRKIYSLKASKNAADRLAAEIAERGIVPEIVHPRDLDKKLGAEAVHQGLLMEAKPLDQPRLDQIEKSGIANHIIDDTIGGSFGEEMAPVFMEMLTEYAEGRAAFLEKRRANFTGQ